MVLQMGAAEDWVDRQDEKCRGFGQSWREKKFVKNSYQENGQVGGTYSVVSKCISGMCGITHIGLRLLIMWIVKVTLR